MERPGHGQARLQVQRGRAHRRAEVPPGRGEGGRGAAGGLERRPLPVGPRHELGGLPQPIRGGGTDRAAPATAVKASVVFNTVERLFPMIRDGRLRELTAEKISGLQSELRKLGRTESTIHGYLLYLRAALQWAADGDLIPAVPKFKRIRRAKIGRAGAR